MRPSGVHTETSSTASVIVVGIVLLITITAPPATGTSVQAVQQSGDDSPPDVESAGENDHRVAVPASATAQADSHGGSVGDVVDIDLSVPDGSAGRLYLGSEDKAYLTSVAFSDDGDGEVTLSLNTFLAGGHLGAERRAWSADSGRLTNVTRHTDPLSDPLEPAVYDVNLTVDGSERAVAPLSLRAASVEAVTTSVAPVSDFGDEPAEITSTRTDGLAIDDTLVANVTATGVFGMLAAQSGETTTERFRSLVTGDNASLEIRPDTVDADLALDRSFENGGLDVYADPDAETLSIVMDTAALQYEGDASGMQAGEEYLVVFDIESESGLTIDEAAEASRIRVHDRTGSFETGETGTVRLAPEPDARLSGTTALAPGTELEVAVRAAGTFLRWNETRVDEDGTFSTRLNLSAVEPGAEFTASVDGLDVETAGIVTNGTGRDAAPDRVTATEQRSETRLTETEGGGNVLREAVTNTAASSTESTPTNRTGTATDESGDGFGAVAALLAVVTLAGLALRRRRI